MSCSREPLSLKYIQLVIDALKSKLCEAAKSVHVLSIAVKAMLVSVNYIDRVITFYIAENNRSVFNLVWFTLGVLLKFLNFESIFNNNYTEPVFTFLSQNCRHLIIFFRIMFQK